MNESTVTFLQELFDVLASANAIIYKEDGKIILSVPTSPNESDEFHFTESLSADDIDDILNNEDNF